MTIRCIFHFAQAHDDFRLPELNSIAELHGITISWPPDEEEWDPAKPFWIVELQEEGHAVLLARRCILIRAIYHLYAHGDSYAAIFAQTTANAALWSQYIPSTTFRFKVSAYNHTIPQERQVAVVESFHFMDLKGKIAMRDPEIELAVWEEYDDWGAGSTRKRDDHDGEFKHIYFGRLIAEGTARSLIKKFDVKKRSFFGSTSMEAEISLLMANQTLASSGSMVYDPFIGTGSMAYTTAHFGAHFFGSDIDGRQMRGKGKTPGIMRAATQYGVEARIVDVCTFDVTRNPWRCGALFDAIVTDPPYGVRAGAKRLGRKNPEKRVDIRTAGREAHAADPCIPPTKPYELSHLVVDLILFARYMLKPNGRLVFFLPTVTDEYEELDIYDMLCDGMEVVANSLQDFGLWGRRVS
ncbi:tRNA guanosine-2'-O-methyltransferase [Rickenella mellea]|uniref:tRNA (guanine(10)-N(2))-methyltransferase n=1 Tax=Rickenella mellea TaxID=50990 RepID=A0A4Y7Q9B9_9AGAM|nr:tRNA guanosine-2'-O-methyltransferase [Rickenella mellea]